MERYFLLIALFGSLVTFVPLDSLSGQDMKSELATPELRKARSGTESANKVDLNSAGPGELGKLPGIAASDVARIIQGRPYKKLDELVTKKVLGKKQFALIREYVGVGPGRK
jgi:DNA uptake protein ComE-like DNA-binding protein